MMNISTRVPIRTGDGAGIGGFILQGSAPRKVMIRAIGPSLNVDGRLVEGRLQDPELTLYDRDGKVIASNDDWRSSQEAEIRESGIEPRHDKEAAVLIRLEPNDYTAVIRGVGGTSGIGLIEIYDIESSETARLANISTRGVVDGGDNILIGGFILEGGAAQKLLVRVIGPDLSSRGVPGALQDPVVELRDSNGALLMRNDNWKQNQQTEIEATGIPPTVDTESALLMTLGSGNYTALVSGKDDTTGVALIEVYNLGDR
jgi:hypothetical protein